MLNTCDRTGQLCLLYTGSAAQLPQQPGDVKGNAILKKEFDNKGRLPECLVARGISVCASSLFSILLGICVAAYIGLLVFGMGRIGP